MLSSDNKEFFLSLVRLGIGNETVSSSRFQVPSDIDWDALEALAAEQGLSAVVVDGVDKLPLESRPPKPVLLQWIGETLQGYEYRYGQYCKAIAEMASFYNKHGFRMMVLKGYACSLDWPRPDHRPCGDIDIWVFGQQEAADKALVSWFKVQDPSFEIDNSHHHHSVFNWGEFMVENHYEIVNTLVSRSNAKIERLLEELAMNDNYFVEIYRQKVWTPSPNFHALFLLRHAGLHFAGEGINIRQILDWGFFVKAHGSQIDWDWFLKVLEEYGMKPFFCSMNAICIKYLGFSASDFPTCDISDDIIDRIVNDIFSPEFVGNEPSNILSRVVFKYRRRRAREWKHKLCYKASQNSHLLTSLWLHITHPDMI